MIRMERNDIYNTMIKISEDIKTAKEKRLKSQSSIDSIWERVNKIWLDEEKKIWDDKSEKVIKEEKEFRVKFAKFNNAEAKLILTELYVPNEEIKKLDLEIELLENKFKALRTAYGVFNL